MNEVKQGYRRKKDFFIVYNMIFDVGLSLKAMVVYLYLRRCSDEEGQAFPSYNNIGKKCNIGARTAQRAIQELEKIGLLTKEHRTNGKGGVTSNLYTIWDCPEEKGVDDGLNDIQQFQQSDPPPSHDDQAPLAMVANPPSHSDQAPLAIVANPPRSGWLTNKTKTTNTQFKDTQSNLFTRARENFRTHKKCSRSRTDEIRKELRAQLGIDILNERNTYDSMVNDLIEFMTEVMASSNRYWTISGNKIRTEDIKERFKFIGYNDIELLIEQFNRQQHEIRNPKAYLLACLYNAPITSNAYWSNKNIVDEAKNNPETSSSQEQSYDISTLMDTFFIS